MAAMTCPKCGDTAAMVSDSRPNALGIRRRRKCPCGHRFTTIEVPDDIGARGLVDISGLDRQARATVRSLVKTLSPQAEPVGENPGD